MPLSVRGNTGRAVDLSASNLSTVDSSMMILKPTSGWLSIDFREIWQYRDLLLALAMRDVKLRYRQTALGVLWVILQPLIAAGLFSLIFGQVAKLPSDGVPYFLFSFAGLLGWNAFNSTLSKTSTCLIGNNAPLVSKIYFPRLILPLSTLLSTLIDFGVGLAMLAILLPFYHIVPHWGLLLLPVWLGLILLLALGLGLVAAALTVSYRDVQFVLPVLMQFALYATPIAYAISAIPHRFYWFFFLNPLTGLLEALRWSLLGIGYLPISQLLWSTLEVTVLFFWGLASFRRMERTFADVI